jgi:hypothetical protein
MAVSAERHRALRLLAGSPLGCTEAIITIEMLTVLVRDRSRVTQAWCG